MPGNQVAYRANERESSLSAVSLQYLRRNQTVKTSVNHLFLVAFCPFGDYPFAPRHFPKVRGVARATIISLSDLVLVGACIHR